MSRINTTRVILAGLLAGLIINTGEFVLNTFVIGDEMNAQLTKMNLPPMSGNAIAVFIAFSFLAGIVTVWLYAAMRPRFGAGPKTAMIAGGTVWFLAYAYGVIVSSAMGMVTSRIAAISLTCGLVEVTIAALAGGYVYQEEAPAARSPARL